MEDPFKHSCLIRRVRLAIAIASLISQEGSRKSQQPSIVKKVAVLGVYQSGVYRYLEFDDDGYAAAITHLVSPLLEVLAPAALLMCKCDNEPIKASRLLHEV